MITDLNERTRQILKHVVDTYVATGEPVGSKAVSEKMGLKLSPATIRHAMAELEARGLLYAPHTSAGRLPTDSGLAVFVDGLLEIDRLSAAEERAIQEKITSQGAAGPQDMLERAGEVLSGLASCAGLVFAPATERSIRQIEFVLLSPGRALAVLVNSNGSVENKLVDIPPDVTASALVRAANYINSQIGEKTLAAVLEHLKQDMLQDRQELDLLTARVVESGLASFSETPQGGLLFIKGQARLLDDVTALSDLERIRALFDALETKESMQRLFQATAQGDGVKIFIGADNSLFTHAGCAMIVSPYKTADARVVGALGVIGPTRLNYGRIIPVINYTSELIGRIIK